LDIPGALESVDPHTLASDHVFHDAPVRAQLTTAFFLPDLPPPKLS